MKRLIAVCLALFVLGGCGARPQDSPQNGQEAETKEFTYYCTLPYALDPKYDNMAGLSMYQELERRTGVKIHFIHQKGTNVADDLNLMIASKELPDLMEMSWSVFQGGPEKAIRDNIIIPLNDLLEQNSPNFVKILKSKPEYDKQSKTDSGIYYGYPSFNVGNYRTFGGLMIRKDWLDELDLQVPETLEDWEIALRAFKEVKGAQAPFTSDNTLTSDGMKYTFNNVFGVGLGLYLENGTVKFAPLEPGYKDFIMLLHRWYEEGLLDNNYQFNSQQAIEVKMTTGQSGACFGYNGGNLGKYMTMMKEVNPKYNLVAAQYPVMRRGDEPSFIEMQREANEPFLSITSLCGDPEAAARWIDYLYGEEGNLLKNFGIEGDTYRMEFGKPIYTDKILNNPDGLSISDAMATNFRANSPAPGLNQVEDYLMQYYQLPQQKEALSTWSKYTENAKKSKLPPVTPLIEEADELESLNTTLFAYISDMVQKFIQGSEPMENYDKFVQTLRSMGADRMIELNQRALERYNRR